MHELRAKEKTLNEQVAALKPLLASGGVSRKQLEDEELVLGAVIAERKMIESGKQREQVELELAAESYERRHLRSPIQGVVSKVMPRIGESIAPHDPVVQVVDISRVRFVGNIPAKLGAGLQAGSKVRIRLGAEDNGLMREARVVFVSPVTDPASGLVEVIAEFDNADGSVRPGITGRLLF